LTRFVDTVHDKLEFKFKKNASYDLDNESIYNNLKKVSGSFFYQKEMTNIFITAMAIGFLRNNPIAIKSPSNSIPTAVFTKQEKWMMIAVYMATKRAKVDALYEPDDILKTSEEFANGGIKYVDLIYKGGSFDDPLEQLEHEFRALLI